MMNTDFFHIIAAKSELYDMDPNIKEQSDTFLGSIEQHAGLLTVPPDGQLLYKVMTAENLLHSITNSYLYFNRVDNYKYFSGADPHDGQQLPKDQQGNAEVRFEKDPSFSAVHYYDQSRSRTY